MVKIVFIDFDGTLYSHSLNKIPSSTVKAINKLQEKGILVFICTGRSLYEVKDFNLENLKFDGYICNNGQLAYDKDENVIIDTPIDGKLKELIVKLFNAKTVPLIINTKDNLFINYVSDVVVKTQNIINSPIPRVKEYENEPFYMSSGYYENQDRWDELMEIKQYANITYWFDGAVDIVPNTATKANAVEDIIKIYNINQDETMAFGDSENDVGLLKYCNVGVAMGNGDENTKNAADYITDDINNDGLYNACIKYNLI